MWAVIAGPGTGDQERKPAEKNGLVVIYPADIGLAGTAVVDTVEGGNGHMKENIEKGSLDALGIQVMGGLGRMAVALAIAAAEDENGSRCSGLEDEVEDCSLGTSRTRYFERWENFVDLCSDAHEDDRFHERSSGPFDQTFLHGRCHVAGCLCFLHVLLGLCHGHL